MTRNEKISKIIDLARKLMFLDRPIKTSAGVVDIINEYGAMKDIDGDWCLVATFKPTDDIPTLSDDDVDIIYDALVKRAKSIMQM